MVLAAVLGVLIGGAVAALLALRHHPRDDFGPSVRDFAAFRAALAATGRRGRARA